MPAFVSAGSSEGAWALISSTWCLAANKSSMIVTPRFQVRGIDDCDTTVSGEGDSEASEVSFHVSYQFWRPAHLGEDAVARARGSPDSSCLASSS